MTDKKDISIKDIAKLAGVSIATVSRIINQNGRFSKETEHKVLEIIEQYGFVSNNVAKSLRNAQSKTIGLIIPNIKNSFFASVASTVEEYFSQKDYSVFICNTSNNAAKEKNYFKKLQSQLVDGILVISGLQSIPNNITTKQIPIVLIDRNPSNDMGLPCVCSNDYEGTYRATQTLISKECKNILYIDSHTAEYDKKLRSSGYMNCLKDNNIPFDGKKMLRMQQNSIPSNEKSEVLVSEYLAANAEVDGIVCASDNAAIGAIYALRRANLRVPEDVKVFGFDNSFVSRIVSPSLSTIGRNPELMAEIACDLLFKKMNNISDERNQVVLPVDIIERESTH